MQKEDLGLTMTTPISKDTEEIFITNALGPIVDYLLVSLESWVTLCLIEMAFPSCKVMIYQISCMTWPSWNSTTGTNAIGYT